MSVTKKRSTWVLAGALWALAAGAPSFADDTELFVSSTTAFANVNPNIMFIIDTSGSMRSSVVTQATYNPAFSYGGGCDAARVYWRRGSGSPPGCGTNQWFDRTAFMCDAALQSFGSAGFYNDRMAQYDDDDDDRWERLDTDEKDWLVECQDDSGILRGQEPRQ